MKRFEDLSHSGRCDRLRSLKVCAGCKHHVSAHRYEPDPGGRTNLPPKKCSVPGCTCEEFKRKESTR